METKEQREEFFENLIDAIRDIKRQIQNRLETTLTDDFNEVDRDSEDFQRLITENRYLSDDVMVDLNNVKQYFQDIIDGVIDWDID